MGCKQIAIQYDFFKTEEESEIECMKRSIEKIDESCHKVRKGIYAKHGEILKIVNDLQERLEIIEKNICKA
jgi:hypothetical protein